MLKRHYLAVIFLIFIFVLIVFNYKDYGIAWDEKIFFNTGKFYAIKIMDYLRLPHNLTNNGFEPTPHHIKGHGVFSDILIIFASLPFKNFNFETLHLLRAIFSLPIFFLIYWIVSRMFSKVYGLISLVFLLLFPRFYPEIFYNAVDVPTTLFFTISLAYFIYYSNTKQTILKSILFGLILAVTINQRLLLFYLPILNFIFLVLLSLRGLRVLGGRGNLKSQEIASLHKSSLATTLINQSTIFLSLIFFLHLTHPYLLTHPVTGLFDILQSAKQYPWNAAVLFDGQQYQAGVIPLPWYYLPKSMLITIPPLITLLFFIGNLRFLYASFLAKLLPIRQRPSSIGTWLLLYLILIFYIPIILTFIFKPTLYDSWRQFLFLTVPMMVIAVYGLDFIIRISNFKAQMSNQVQSSNVKKEYKKSFGFWILKLIWNLKFVIWILIIINLSLVAKQMVLLHPYQYLYYNSFVGGLKGAYGKYETDYWGLGFKEAVLWFKQNINDPKKTYKIYVEGDPLSSSYYFKPNMQLTTDLVKADYIFTFTRWNFHIRHPGKTIYTVEREGIPLIFIKKL